MSILEEFSEGYPFANVSDTVCLFFGISFTCYVCDAPLQNAQMGVPESTADADGFHDKKKKNNKFPDQCLSQLEHTQKNG